MTPEIDPSLLTAYALGELDPSDHVKVSAYLQANPEAEAIVEEVRATARLVSTAFQNEPARLSQRGREGTERLRIASIGTPPAYQIFAGRAPRGHRWLPLVASVAASAVIVMATLAFLFARLNVQIASSRPTDQALPVTQPDDSDGAAVRDVTPAKDDAGEDLFVATLFPEEESDQSEIVDEEEVALNADFEPASITPALGPGEALSKVAAAPPNRMVRAARRPAPSPEAERIRRSVVRASALPKEGAVINVSPILQGPPLDQISKARHGNRLQASYENPFRSTTERSISTFPLRVETSSYRAIRKQLAAGRYPPANGVRIEELVNRFAYDYRAPAEDGAPFSLNVEITTCPWAIEHRLARIGIKAREGGATVVAREVEAKIEFDAAEVKSWRLIGYENGRAPQTQPAGFATDIAAGGAATALYEILPTTPDARGPNARNVLTVTLSYLDAHTAMPETIALTATDAGNGFDRASDDQRFAASLASFGMQLRDSSHKGSATFADVIRWATAGKGADETGDRTAFIELARQARDLGK